MCAPFSALPSLEISVRGAGTALPRRDPVRIHSQAHRAARFAPFEAGLEQDTIETFLLGLSLHEAGRWHDKRPYANRDRAIPGDRGGRADVLDTTVGAGADNHDIDSQAGHSLAAFQP